MIMDKSLLLSDKQVITVTAVSDNIIDLGAVGTPVNQNAQSRDIGRGTPVPILIQANAAFDAAGAATLTVDVQVDDASNFPSPKTIWSSGAIGKAALVKGWRAMIDYLPKGVDERYLRVNYTVATGPMTAGSMTAGIVGDHQMNQN